MRDGQLRNHPDQQIAELFARLQNALVSWERATGRCSFLIFRESIGNPMIHGPMPSDIVIRLDNGISVDPSNADLSDAALLTPRFTDTNKGGTEDG